MGELRLLINHSLLVLEFRVAPLRIKGVLVVAQSIGAFVAARWSLQGFLVLIVGCIASLLEDVAVIPGWLALRVFHEHTGAVLGSENIHVLVALVFGLDLFEASGEFVHCLKPND